MRASLLVIVSYLLGAIPTGYWLIRVLKGIDLRRVGSGSTGATNVLRTAGWPAAGFVFVIDILKGYLVVAAAIHSIRHGWLTEFATTSWLTPWVPPLCGIAAIIGHSKSVFLNFDGGKSAATGCGTLIGCNPIAGFSALGLWFLVLGTTRIVSVASITAALACPILIWFCTRHTPEFQASFTGYAAVGGAYVIIRHKANVQRLLAGTEPRVGQ